ncbi:MAG: response regulator [Bryobacterales bacterium]|nr:response regulator [Bryobacterales bacterium]
MTTLIADDEPIALEILREQLGQFPDIEIVGEASTGKEVIAAIGRLHPDVLFLDVQLPDFDGFAALQALKPGASPQIVFVTAYEQYAVNAFNAGAADYLVKPVRAERLAAAIERVRARQQQPAAVAAAPAPAAVEPPLRRIVGRLGADLHMIDFADAISFEAEGEVVYVTSARGRFLVNSTLRELESRLPSPPFRRIHRKSIINTDHIRKISPMSSKRWVLKMSNGADLIVSKRLTSVIRGEIVS